MSSDTCQVPVSDIKCQIINVSVSGESIQSHNIICQVIIRSCNMIQENSIVKRFKLFTIISITKIINLLISYAKPSEAGAYLGIPNASIIPV